MATALPRPGMAATASPWELAAETIAVKIRWFGLVVGCVLVNLGARPEDPQRILNAILAVGACYTLLDTWCSLRGRVFLGRYPVVVAGMESLFIGLLCFYHGGLESSFRFFYLLSLICCAVRNATGVTYAACALHCLSYSLLLLVLPPDARHVATYALTVVLLCWVTWASDALALLLKRVGDYLGRLNASLQVQHVELEARIADRTRALQEAQAHVLHQEKMAAFGLLAAGIAHEVGNPLTSVSALVQILQRREKDPYTLEKLSLVSGQLQRIRTTLRELVEYSRPASDERGRVALGDILDEALNIAKYYKRTRGRIRTPELPADLPPLFGVRDQLVQVFLNLILNAMDAVDRDGRIDVEVRRVPAGVEVLVRDNGCGIAPQNAARLFQPYFTTKIHGTGLGLFVTRQLVADHGGVVSFEPAPERGAVFRVVLPTAVSEPAVDPDHAALEREGAPW